MARNGVDRGRAAAAGRLSLVMNRLAAPDERGLWAGLVVDEWTEILPRPYEQTGVGYHYDDAGAEAPQAVLVAVPPDSTRAATWSSGDILAVLRETFELARIRAIEIEHLDGLGQLLPAIATAWNTANEAVGIPFLAMREGDLTP